jgi:hypothetical protein
VPIPDGLGDPEHRVGEAVRRILELPLKRVRPASWNAPGGSLSGQVCKFVGGWSELGVGEVEASGAVECVFGQASEGACGQDRVFVSFFTEQVHRKAPTGR